MSAIQALIFDLDGLLIDTEAPEYQAWREVYASFGQSLELEVWAAGIGADYKAFDAVAHLEKLLGRQLDRAAVKARRKKRFLELLDGGRPRPGVEDYLRDARRLGLRTAVASSAPRRWINERLAPAGLAENFDAICCLDDVPRAKPEPDLYLAALAEISVTAGEAVAFEDSPNGISAARRAGLFCVAVPNAVTSRLCLDAADLRLESLADVPLEKLLKLISKEKTDARSGHR